jgi:hypothetical protein
VCLTPLNKCGDDGRISTKYGASMTSVIAHVNSRIFEFNYNTYRTKEIRDTCHVLIGPRILYCDALQTACNIVVILRHVVQYK